MRKYGKVSPRIWMGKLAKAIRGDRDAQVMALYLITSPHANMSGLYHLRLEYAAADIGDMTIEGASKALRTLSEANFAYYDEESERVWVVDHARHECGDSLSARDKRVKGLENELEHHRMCPFFNDFLDMYADCFCLGLDKTEPKQTSPYEAPTKPLRSQQQQQYQKQEQKQEQDQQQASPPARAPAESVAESDDFMRFWKAYPRKKKKGDAIKAWQQTDPSTNGNYLKRPGIEAVLSAIEACSKSKDWTKDSGEFIPHPATWLRAAGWEDGKGDARACSDCGRISESPNGWPPFGMCLECSTKIEYRPHGCPHIDGRSRWDSIQEKHILNEDWTERYGEPPEGDTMEVKRKFLRGELPPNPKPEKATH